MRTGLTLKVASYVWHYKFPAISKPDIASACTTPLVTLCDGSLATDMVSFQTLA